MSLKNIKSNTQAQKGFTIVELLIVVVVIAILAAITIVSYNGITSRANSSAAQSSAATFQKKAELFASDGTTGQYPKLLADMQASADSSKSFYIGTGSLNATAGPAVAPTAANGKNTVQYQPCGTFSSGTSVANMNAVTGGNIVWYDFANATTKTVVMGNVSTPNTCAATL